MQRWGAGPVGCCSKYLVPVRAAPFRHTFSGRSIGKYTRCVGSADFRYTFWLLARREWNPCHPGSDLQVSGAIKWF